MKRISWSSLGPFFSRVVVLVLGFVFLVFIACGQNGDDDDDVNQTDDDTNQTADDDSSIDDDSSTDDDNGYLATDIEDATIVVGKTGDVWIGGDYYWTAEVAHWWTTKFSSSGDPMFSNLLEKHEGDAALMVPDSTGGIWLAQGRCIKYWIDGCAELSYAVRFLASDGTTSSQYIYELQPGEGATVKALAADGEDRAVGAASQGTSYIQRFIVGIGQRPDILEVDRVGLSTDDRVVFDRNLNEYWVFLGDTTQLSIVKYDQTLTESWSRDFVIGSLLPVGSAVYQTSLVVDDEGGLILGVDVSLPSGAVESIFAHIESNGETVWNLTETNLTISELAIGPDGQLFASGFKKIDGAWQDYVLCIGNNGEKDWAIATSGLTWSKCGFDHLPLGIDESGNLYLGGGELLSYTSAGLQRWQVAAPQGTCIPDLSVSASGEVAIVAGRETSSVLITKKYSPSGTELWTAEFDPNNP